MWPRARGAYKESILTRKRSGKFLEDPVAHGGINMEMEGDGKSIEKRQEDGKLPRRHPMLRQVCAKGAGAHRPPVDVGNRLLEGVRAKRGIAEEDHPLTAKQPAEAERVGVRVAERGGDAQAVENGAKYERERVRLRHENPLVAFELKAEPEDQLQFADEAPPVALPPRPPSSSQCLRLLILCLARLQLLQLL